MNASDDAVSQRPEKFIVQDSTCLNRGITITGNTFSYCTENAIEINSAKQNVIVMGNIFRNCDSSINDKDNQNFENNIEV